MSKLAYVAWAAVLGALLFLPLARGQEDDFAYDTEPALPRRKDPKFLLRPAKHAPTEQLTYANALRGEGRTRKAMKQCEALVRTWHDSPEAAEAQFMHAELLEQDRQYVRAFDEYQYLIDNYAGSFDFSDVLDRQLRIANQVMSARHGGLFLFRGFSSPERAIPLFRKIAENGPRSDVAPQALFRLGLINEESNEMEEALKAYETVCQRYPGTDLAAEAAFRRAHCLYQRSIGRRRDENSAREALSALAGFVRDYPDNANAEQAERYRRELTEGLLRMYYERAEFYDKIAKRPESAIIAYSDFASKFPMSKLADKARERVKELERELGEKENHEK